jgi:hypothetical protein
MYTLEMAKSDHKEGWLDNFELERNQKNDWKIILKNENGFSKCLTLARGGDRTFKTLDAAVSVVEEIGWSVDYLTR